MNAKKEAEYIAEIVQLKRDLQKAKLITNNGEIASNSDLKDAAEKCINQIVNNVGGNTLVSIHKHETLSGLGDYYYLYIDVINRVQ